MSWYGIVFPRRGPLSWTIIGEHFSCSFPAKSVIPEGRVHRQGDCTRDYTRNITRYQLFSHSVPQHFARIPWAPMTPYGTAKEPVHVAVVAKNPGHSGRVVFFNYLCKWLCGTLWVLGWTSISHQSYLPGRPKPPRFIRV